MSGKLAGFRWIHFQVRIMLRAIRIFRSIFAIGLGTFVGLVGSASKLEAAQTASVPRTIDIHAAIQEHFSYQRDYRSGDFLTRGKVEEALKTLERKTGWQLEAGDRETLLKQTLDDKSFLAQQLSSKLGKQFSRNIQALPLGYDKLDRLSQLPQGRSTIERLVIGPDGHKLLQYMANSPGGHDLSRMLSQDGKGNFEKPTGKIYDEKQLTLALAQLHKSALARQAGAQRTGTGSR
ncbi:MAG: hypothetical protein K8U03_15160 [Planctomycetia bacterium]|nr:hypothetical protein [Planctomycetia bacterium]